MSNLTKTYKVVHSDNNGGWTVRLEDELGFESKLIAKTGNAVDDSEMYAERIANALNQMEIEG